MDWILVPERPQRRQSVRNTGITWNVTYGTSPAVPVAVRNAVTDACALISAACPNVMLTINMTVNYQIGSSNAAGSPDTPPATLYTFAQAKSFYTANQTTPDMVTFVANLPSSDPGLDAYYLSGATRKLFGLLSPTNPDNDLTIVIGDGVPTTGLPGGRGNIVGVCMHEILHGLGRANYIAGYSLCRFVSPTPTWSANPGVYQTSWLPTSLPSYYSIDGGFTRLADFDTTGNDNTDFLVNGVQDTALGIPDACDCLYFNNSSQLISPVDLTTLHICGFH